MAAWAESPAGFWFGGLLFSGFWEEQAGSGGRICYLDPAEGWAVTPKALFGRTVEADGAAMARQGTEAFGMPWYSGGGLVLFRGADRWYLVRSTSLASPSRTPRAAWDEEGEYTGDEAWYSADFDPWGPDGAEYGFSRMAGEGGPATRTVALSAPDIARRVGSAGGTAPFGRYGDGTWIGAPCWGGTPSRPRVWLAGAGWRGCSESGGLLTLDLGGLEYSGPAPAVESDAVFSYAGPDDGLEHPDATLAWNGYGRPALLGPEDAVEAAVAEAATWR